jgi:hypothetical protein
MRRLVGVVVVVLVAAGLVYGVAHHISESARPYYHGPRHSSIVTWNGWGSNASTGSASGLASLNGTVYSLHGEEITRELWARMRDYNTTDPRIAAYIDWLRKTLSSDPSKALLPNPVGYKKSEYGGGWVYDENRTYYFWVDEYGWRATPPQDGIVRIGVVRLGFGAGLIVTAYPSGGSVDIVVHGTVLDPDEYVEVVHRVMLGRPELYGMEDRMQDYRYYYVLYRIRLPGHGSTIQVEGQTLRVGNVYVLLEMPAIVVDHPGKHPVYEFEYEYADWMILGRPALGLAINLAYSPGTDPLKLYQELVVTLTENLNSYGDYYIDWRIIGSDSLGISSGLTTPLMLRLGGGVCFNHAEASIVLASAGLGGIVATLTDAGHALSLLVLPSTVFRHIEMGPQQGEGYPGVGPVSMYHDLDGDGVNDAGIILANTDPVDYTLARIDEMLEEADYGASIVGPTFDDTEFILCLVPDGSGAYIMDDIGYVYRLGPFYLAGFTEYVRSLPDWLTPPWYPMLKRVAQAMIMAPTEDQLGWYMHEYSGFLPVLENKAMMLGPAVTPSLRQALNQTLPGMPLIDGHVEGPPVKLYQLLNYTKIEVNATGGDGEYTATTTLPDGSNLTITIHRTGDIWYTFRMKAYINGEYVGHAEHEMSSPHYTPETLQITIDLGNTGYYITVHLPQQ